VGTAGFHGRLGRVGNHHLNIGDADRARRILRGGAFKPRSSPYSFQGLGVEGLKLLRRAADRHRLAVVTEVMTTEQIETVCEYADLLQVAPAICRTSRF
jgi:3-deoxy-D-arabino-heptulosonate 7-phosphate (DAHP) synthase